MTEFTLSSSTQALIVTALASPGTNNANYLAAYNAISAEIAAHPGVNPGTQYWFSQAGTVNGQAYSPSPAGTYIWAYTKGAAATFGDTITDTQLQTASNRIALAVFGQLADNDFVFNDIASGPNNLNFSPAGIVRNDAGEGIGYLQSLFPNLDYSIWGGTLFARTVLGDSSYVSDYNLNLTPGSSDCNAIFAGQVAGVEASTSQLLSSPGVIISQIIAATEQDRGMLQACYPIPTSPLDLFPSLLNFNQFGQISSQSTTLTDGGSSTTYYIYNDTGDVAGGVTASQATPSSPTIITTVSLANGSSGSGYSTNYVLNGTPSVQVGFDTTLSADGSGPAVLVGAGNTVLNGAAGQSVFISLGNRDTINDGSDNGTDSDVDLEGNGDIANVGSNVSLTDNGVGNSVSAGPGAIVNIGGSLGTYVLAANAMVSDTTANNTISTGPNSTVNIYGDDVTVTNSGSGCTDGIHCAGDIVNSTDNAINIGDNDSVTVNGSSDTVATGVGDVLVVYGGGDAVTAQSGCHLYLSATNTDFDDVTVSNDTSDTTAADGEPGGIYLGQNVDVTVNGNNNSLPVGGASGCSVNVLGGGNAITAELDDHLYLAATGTDFDTVNVSNDTANDVDPNGEAGGIYLGNNVDVTVNGDNNSLPFGGASGCSVNILGGGNAITAAADDHLYLGSTGTDFDTVNVSNDTTDSVDPNGEAGGIYLGNNVDVTVNGDNNSLPFGGASGCSVNVLGGGNAITAEADDHLYLGSTGTDFDTVNVSNDTANDVDPNGEAGGLYLGNSVDVTVNGDNNSLPFGGASGCSVNVLGGGNTITAEADDHLYLGATGTDFDTVNVSNDTANDVDPNGEAGGIYLGNNVDVTVNGDNNSLPFGGASGCFVQIFGASNDITAENGDVVVIGNNNVASLDSVDVSNDQSGIIIDDHAAANISGGNDTVYLQTANSYVGLLGGADYIVGASAGGMIDTSDNTSLSVYGSDAQIGLGTGCDLALNGGSGYTVSGNLENDNIFATTSTSLSVTGQDTNVILGSDLSANSAALGNDSLTISGGGNGVFAQAGDFVDLSDTGTDLDTVIATNDLNDGSDSFGQPAGIFVNNAAQTNISGGYDQVDAGAGSYVGLLGGSGYSVAGSDFSIATTNDTNFNAYGSGNDLNLAANDNAGVYGGGGNDVNAPADAQVNLANTNGDSDTVNSSNNTVGIYIAADTQAIINGSNDRAYLLGSDITLTSGNNSFIEDISGPSGIVISANDSFIDIPASESVTVNGSGDYLSGSNDRVDVVGNNDVTAGNYDDVTGSGSGDYTTDATDDDSGSETYVSSFDYSTYADEDYGGYSFTYDGGYGMSRTVTGNAKSGIDVVAQYDSAAGYQQQAAGASAALASATLAADAAGGDDVSGTPPADIFWQEPAITWSFAAGASGGASPISSAIGEQEQPVIEAAIEAWAATAGVTLQQVSGQADINIGWGDFDTPTSGVVGYTAATSFANVLQSGTVLRLEDPAETPLVADAEGDLVYSGTDVTLYQAALHEIGHALGLADDSDPDSIMYPTLGPNNLGLDATDISAIQNLYGPGGVASASSAPISLLAAQAAITAAAAQPPMFASGAVH